MITKVKMLTASGKVWIEVDTGEAGEFDLKEYLLAEDKEQFFKENF